MTQWKNLYKQLWNNRSFCNFEEAMKNELLDEASHPRVRKQPEVKFLEAVRRIEGSNLSDEEKMTLISAYIVCMEKVNSKRF